MQIYLKPYPHNTYCNVPYAEEKTRHNGTRNYGYKDVKKFRGLIKKIPEVKDSPKLGDLIQKINQEMFTTSGCDIGVGPVGIYHQSWAFVNFHFDDMDLNHTEENYFNLVAKFLEYFATEQTENLVIEFIINPTNFHDPERIKKGVKPNEDTVMFRGYSINCKIIGVGESIDLAKSIMNLGLDHATEFLSRYNI